MSYYIEHNRAIIKTKDKGIIVLSKGGDNNVYSASGRRIVSWDIAGIYPSKQHFIALFLKPIIQKDYDWAGNIQLYNKPSEYNNLLEYKMHALKLWDNAYKKNIVIDFTLNDLMKTDVNLVDSSILELLKKYNYSIKDEDGVPQLSLFYDKEGFKNRVQRALNNSKTVSEHDKESVEWLEDLIKQYNKNYNHIDAVLKNKDADFIRFYLSCAYKEAIGIFMIFYDSRNPFIRKNYPIEYLKEHLLQENRPYLDENDIENFVKLFPVQVVEMAEDKDFLSKLSERLRPLKEVLTNEDYINTLKENIPSILSSQESKFFDMKKRQINEIIKFINNIGSVPQYYEPLIYLSWEKWNFEKLDNIFRIIPSLNFSEADLKNIRNNITWDTKAISKKLNIFYKETTTKSQMRAIKKIKKHFKTLYQQYENVLPDDVKKICQNPFSLKQRKFSKKIHSAMTVLSSPSL